MQSWDVVVIGAGGAGMMCAAEAGRRGRRVLVIDHSERIGRKILISGGGRCNFTNIHARPENYFSKNPHFAKSALSRFSPEDFIKLVRDYRIPFHEKKLGQLFCDGSAQSIVDLLLDRCESAGVTFWTSCRVISVDKGDDRFEIVTSGGKVSCQSLVIASGGLSIPKIGASGFGYEVAKKFGLKLVETYPALVGLNFDTEDLRNLGDLSGLSLDSSVTCGGKSFRENILFTHTGLSGPAILQASLYWGPGKEIVIDGSPELDLAALLIGKRKAGNKSLLKNVLADSLPRRFAERFTDLYLPDRPLNELAEKTVQDIATKISGWRLKPRDTFGYVKAEVTRGGVDTTELNSKTMEARKVSGLHFIGEVVDVTGQLGGYNFQWAWASGVASGEVV